MKLLTNKYLLLFLGLLAFRLSFVLTDYLKYIIIFQVLISLVCLGIFEYEKRKSDFSLIKYALIIFILVDFTFNLSAGHYLLANRKELFLLFDDLNSFQSELFVLLKMLSLTITIFFQNKALELLAEPAEIIARFSLDIFPIKNMAIDADLQSNIISIDDANVKRNKLNKVSYYFDDMDLIRKLINNKIIINIISFVFYFVLGTLIAVNVNDEPVSKAINLSLSLSIIYALYFIISSLFLVIVFKCSIKEELKAISNAETIMGMKEDCFDKKWNQAYDVFKKYVLKQNDYFTRNDILKDCPSLEPMSLYPLIQKSKNEGIIVEKMYRKNYN
jgi:type III secretory pathway component EscV